MVDQQQVINTTIPEKVPIQSILQHNVSASIIPVLNGSGSEIIGSFNSKTEKLSIGGQNIDTITILPSTITEQKTSTFKHRLINIFRSTPQIQQEKNGTLLSMEQSLIDIALIECTENKFEIEKLSINKYATILNTRKNKIIESIQRGNESLFSTIDLTKKSTELLKSHLSEAKEKMRGILEGTEINKANFRQELLLYAQNHHRELKQYKKQVHTFLKKSQQYLPASETTKYSLILLGKDELVGLDLRKSYMDDVEILMDIIRK